MDGEQRYDFNPTHRCQRGDELTDLRHREPQSFGCDIGGFGKHSSQFLSGIGIVPIKPILSCVHIKASEERFDFTGSFRVSGSCLSLYLPRFQKSDEIENLNLFVNGQRFSLTCDDIGISHVRVSCCCCG